MMRKISGLLCIALIGVCSIGWAAQYPLTVEEIAVDGNDEIRRKDILDVVSFDVGDAIEEAQLRAASEAIYELGWFEEVSVDYDILDQGIVTFRVVENPVVEKIVITGNINRRDVALFGVKLFEQPIMSTFKVREILRDNDVRRRDVLNRTGLTTALEEILAEYQRRGYPLVSIGNVSWAESLEIELLEQVYAGSLIEGLKTVPESVAMALIEIPVDQPLLMSEFQSAYTSLNQSVYFEEVAVEPQQGMIENSVWLRWTVQERELLDSPTRIDRISIEGNTVYEDDLLAHWLGDLPGESIGNYELLEIVKGVQDRYIRGGYTLVKLSVAAIEEGHLRLHIAEGEISAILLQGNTHTQDYVIARNMEVETGRVFNRKDLVVSYQQLMGLGYFAVVDVLPAWGDEGVEITVTVTEMSDLGGFGGSMAIDPSTGHLFGQLSLHEKNVFGTGQDLELSYERGLVGTGDTKPSTWNLGYSTVAYFPGFDRVGLDFYQQTDEITEDEETLVNITLGAEISFSYPVADYSNLGLSFRHEEEHMTHEAFWTPADVINLALFYDDTNDPFFPTEGSRRRLGVEKAGGFSAGREYTKVDLTWTHFIPGTMPWMATDMDQAVAIRIKTGWGDADVPTSGLTELGGPMSIRGVTGDRVRQYAFANLEYRLKLTEGMVVSAFWDGGFDLRTIRFDDILSSFGFELAINAAGVLVRLDLAWDLSEDFTWVPVFDFGFGQMF